MDCVVYKCYVNKFTLKGYYLLEEHLTVIT